MRLYFEDTDLERLWTDETFHLPRFGSDITKAFRKKVNFLYAAATQQDIRAMASLHLEKLQGNRLGQHSIRLNDQWRIILRFDRDDQGQLIVVVSIDDYH